MHCGYGRPPKQSLKNNKIREHSREGMMSRQGLRRGPSHFQFYFVWISRIQISLVSKPDAVGGKIGQGWWLDRLLGKYRPISL